MARRTDRAEQRTQRRERRPQNHQALLEVVKEEQISRRIIKPLWASIEPLNDRQAAFQASIHANAVTFGVGPSGTGKTWFGAALAAEAFKDGLIEGITLTHPGVEAGVSLGFRPGTDDEKLAPFVRPMHDALEEVLGSGHLEYALKLRQIEFRPLSHIRGADIKNRWVFFDEAQNSTPGQMKLFLTRIGSGSKAIVTGDVTQSDLEENLSSGLVDAMYRLRGVNRVQFIRFGKEDIVRSQLCKDIVYAYEGDEDLNEDYMEQLSAILSPQKNKVSID